MNMAATDFEKFPKIPRINTKCIITEKLDGTNAQIYISRTTDEFGCSDPQYVLTEHVTGTGVYQIRAGSRNKYLTLKEDNYGFAHWVVDHAVELIVGLGEGRHYGEWWGSGIQRRYNLTEKRFSLFNTARWSEDATRPSCCHVAPILYTGPFSTVVVKQALLRLKEGGSVAAPRFINPEGVVVYLQGANILFKDTGIDEENTHKWQTLDKMVKL